MVKDLGATVFKHNIGYFSFLVINRLSLRMEKMSMDTALLIISGEGALIVLLMGALSFLYIADKKNTNRRMDKQDEVIDKLADFMHAQQEQITSIAGQVKGAIDVINTNQNNDTKRMDFMEKMVLQAVTK